MSDTPIVELAPYDVELPLTVIELDVLLRILRKHRRSVLGSYHTHLSMYGNRDPLVLQLRAEFFELVDLRQKLFDYRTIVLRTNDPTRPVVPKKPRKRRGRS